MPALGPILDAADRLGVVALLLLFVFGLSKGWWVLGSAHDRIVKLIEERRADDVAITKLNEVANDQADRNAMALEGMAASTDSIVEFVLQQEAARRV